MRQIRKTITRPWHLVLEPKSFLHRIGWILTSFFTFPHVPPLQPILTPFDQLCQIPCQPVKQIWAIQDGINGRTKLMNLKSGWNVGSVSTPYKKNAWSLRSQTTEFWILDCRLDRQRNQKPEQIPAHHSIIPQPSPFHHAPPHSRSDDGSAAVTERAHGGSQLATPPPPPTHPPNRVFCNNKLQQQKRGQTASFFDICLTTEGCLKRSARSYSNPVLVPAFPVDNSTLTIVPPIFWIRCCSRNQLSKGTSFVK